MSQRTRNIRNAYDIINSRGDLISTIYEREVDTTSTSLSLHGRGFWPAGRQRNENVVALIENFSGSTPPNNPTAGQFWWKRNDQLYVFEPAIGSPSWKTVVPPSSGIGFRISPGNGIKSDPSDGLPVGSPLTTTLSINAGRGFTFSGNSLITNDSEIVHDDLLGFVANEHLDHSNIQLIGGAGFAVGSPTSIIGSVSMNVGAGKGITVGSQVAVNSNV